ncbi:tyrosine-type recombinase/integrase [Thermoplasmatales archaeon AK]|nr:tyrosine-type recombinase/integrase [Thermoplasmatales archaeon AK]
MKVAGLTDYRVVFYVVRLRVLSKIMGSAFLKPTRGNITNAITKLQSIEKPKKLSPRTIEDYKQAMRKFYSWHLSKKVYSQVMGHVKIQNNVNRTKKSEDMLTESEIESIVKNAMNPRDKALFSLLYDSGCRVGEILTLRIQDVKFDQYGALIHVTGKTGERNVRIVGNSIAYLREWLRAHPIGNPDSWLFVGINGDKLGQPLDYDTMRSALRKSCIRAGITKKIHPHLFRHSAATRLAGVLSESVLKKSMGWSGSSRMAAIYVHLNDTETDRAVLQAHGIETEKHTLESVKPKACPRCGTLQPSYSKICTNCFMVLDQSLAINTTLSIDVQLDKEQKMPGSLTGKITNYETLKPLLLMIQDMQNTMQEMKKKLEQQS